MFLHLAVDPSCVGDTSRGWFQPMWKNRSRYKMGRNSAAPTMSEMRLTNAASFFVHLIKMNLSLTEKWIVKRAMVGIANWK